MSLVIFSKFFRDEHKKKKLKKIKELTGNEHRLVMSIAQHIIVGIVGNGEDVRRHFVFSLALVDADNVIIVNCEPFVRVHRDAEKSRVRVNHESFVTLGQVVDNGRFGEVSHIRHMYKCMN